MLLAIEQGNTNTMFAIHDGDGMDRPVARGHRKHAHGRRIRSLAVATAVDAGPGLPRHRLGCIISSVVPQSIFNLRNLSRRYFNVEPLVIGENAELGVDVRIDKPSEAGADRLVNAVGAHMVYPGPLIVIDSGTATTFDIVGADGAFEGGIIAPGINLSMQALHEAAAKLPRIAIQRPARNRVVGTDTVSAMQSGVFWGYIA